MNNIKNSPYSALKREGSALIISLVLLTTITLIAITSLQRTSLQTRIVANIQHTESGFHIVNSNLDEIFLSYSAGKATTDLTEAIDKFTLDSDGNKTFGTVDTSLQSSFQEKNKDNPHSIQVSSNITHKGQPSFTSGYSQGGFTTYHFEVKSDSNAPTSGSGHVLSSQSMGIELIGPS